MVPPRSSTRRRRPKRVPWATWSDDDLCALRFRDLGLRVEDTELQAHVDRLYHELAARGLRFRPHVWFSTEWFSPDGVPGIAIPFYLAHPRLKKLERSKLFEIEGADDRSFLRLLRHECGHAIDTAYNLRRRHGFRKHFGPVSTPYLPSYVPKPYTKSFVRNLPNWYAQSHPTEDFAETFAVWLRPRSAWRKTYATWPARKKLEYVDDLMDEIADEAPVVRCREQTESLTKLRMTLGEHYEAKLANYGSESTEVYDRDLRRLFPGAPEDAGRGRSAATFLRRARPELRRAIARWTGQRQYTIDVVIGEMIARCQDLELRLHRTDDEARADATVMLTVQTMNHIHGGHHQLFR